MHELSLTRSIVAIVAEAAHGRRVRKVTLELGALTGVMADAVSFCFDAVVQDTPLAGAALEIVTVAGRARCRTCGAELETPTLFTPCACGSRELTRLAGEELKVKTLEVEEAA